jgi:hypothetical protein
MALILIEGFDHYNMDFAERKGWDINAGLLSGPGRVRFPPSQCVECIINNGTSKALPGSYSELILGFAFRLHDVTPSNDTKFATFDGGPNVGITTTGVLYIAITTGSSLATGTTQILADTWYYCELHATNTHAEVHLDGVSEIASTAGSYLAPWSRVGFEFQQLGGVSVAIDDVYVIDPTTGVNTTFLGPSVVRTLYPDDDATYSDFVPYPTLPTDHFSHVNERFIDDDVTLVYDGTPGHKDSYKMALYGDSPIYGVQLNLGARKGDFGSRQIEPLIRQSATDYTGATSTLGLFYLFYSWLLNQDPSGSDWTIATVDADEFGVEIVA